MNDTIFNLSSLNVVVDTKPMFTTYLKYAAQTKGIRLLTYTSAIAFQKDLHLFGSGTTFFFGQVFYGERLYGTDLAKIVKAKISCRTFIVTVLHREIKEFAPSVDAGHVDLVLPKDMYWSEPCDETKLTALERGYLKEGFEGVYAMLRITRLAFTERRDWLNRIKYIEPSRIPVPVLAPKPIAVETKVAVTLVAATASNKKVAGWFRSMGEFFKLSWLRPNPV